MDIKWMYIVGVILCTYVTDSSEAYLPSVPCAEMFQYTYDGREWYGLAHIFALPIGQTTDTEITLSLPAQLSTQYVGSFDIYGTREAADQEIQSNQPVTYIVRFPLQSPLPKLTQISVNGQVLCSGPPEIAPYVTTIRLERILYTVYQPPVNPSGYNTNYQDPGIIYSNYNNYYPQPSYTQQSYPQQSYPQQSYTQQSYPQQSYPQYTQTALAPIYVQEPQQQYPQIQSKPATDIVQIPNNEICGQTVVRPSFLITGGMKASRGSWPWLVAINVKLPNGIFYICGGNLVSNRVVVTAAHCFFIEGILFNARDFILYLGRHNLDVSEDGEKIIEAEQLIIHSDYHSIPSQQSIDADIAVAIMKERVDYTNYIRPICLWEGSYANNVQGTVVGWGIDDSGKASSVPNEIVIPIIAEAKCLRSISGYGSIMSERTFCAEQRDGSGPSPGDSGSGMTTYSDERWKLLGIVSYVISEDDSATPSMNNYVVFTDIRYFVNWIKNYIQ